MPTYSYACQECGHAFDIRQSFTDDSLTVCPACSAPRLRKVIHPVGIAFKGSGFYKTDSRASANKASTPAADGSGPGEKKKDGAASPSTSSDCSSGSGTSIPSTAATSSGSSGSSSGGSGGSGSSGTASTSSSTAS